MPAIAQAHALRRSGPPHLRWAVEARLLAEEPFTDIGRKCSIPPGAVEAYEKLFFAVLNKLDATTYVGCAVLGPKIHHGLTENDLGVFWGLVGYTYGPVMLDAIIKQSSGLPRPTTAKQLDEVLGRYTEALLRARALLAVHMLPVKPETALAVLQLAAQCGVLGKPPDGEANDNVPGTAPLRAVIAGLLTGPQNGSTPNHRPRSNEPRCEGKRPIQPASAAKDVLKDLLLPVS
jgi:hypothetical protein